MFYQIKRASLLLVLCMLISSLSFGQNEENTVKNQLKINVVSLVAFKTTSLNYERHLNKNLTLSLGFGRKFSGSLPGFFRSEESPLQFTSSGFTGTFYNLEARWYLKQCEGDMPFEGFYIGPYFKMNRYSLEYDLMYDDGSIMETNSGTGKISEYGVGFLVGYQLNFWKRFTLDFIFLGPRTSRYGLNFKFNETLSDELKDAVTNRINAKLDEILMKGNIDPEVTLNEIKSSFNWLSFKYALSIGYAF